MTDLSSELTIKNIVQKLDFKSGKLENLFFGETYFRYEEYIDEWFQKNETLSSFGAILKAGNFT